MTLGGVLVHDTMRNPTVRLGLSQGWNFRRVRLLPLCRSRSLLFCFCQLGYTLVSTMPSESPREPLSTVPLTENFYYPQIVLRSPVSFPERPGTRLPPSVFPVHGTSPLTFSKRHRPSVPFELLRKSLLRFLIQ